MLFLFGTYCKIFTSKWASKPDSFGLIVPFFSSLRKSVTEWRLKKLVRLKEKGIPNLCSWWGKCLEGLVVNVVLTMRALFIFGFKWNKLDRLFAISLDPLKLICQFLLFSRCDIRIVCRTSRNSLSQIKSLCLRVFCQFWQTQEKIPPRDVSLH